MAMFESLDDAMRWAYGHRVSTTQMSTLNAMMGKVAGDEQEIDAPVRQSNPNLERLPDGWDAVAQIGMLKAFVAGLPDTDRWHIQAKYARGAERQFAQHSLRDRVIPLLEVVLRPRWIMYQLVARYYGKRVFFRDLAIHVRPMIPVKDGEKPETHERRVWRMVRGMSATAETWLKDVATRAEERAHAVLKEQGVIL